MTEEERFRATDRFEKELRRMDAERLKKIQSQNRLGSGCSPGYGRVLCVLFSSLMGAGMTGLPIRFS